jgi:hypothetical protein
MSKKNFEAYQDKLNSRFDKAYDRAIKDLAAKQDDPAPARTRPLTRDVFGTTPSSGLHVPASSGPKYPTVDLNDQYLEQLDSFVKFVLTQIFTLEKSEPGPDAVRRIFDEWVSKLQDLAQDNVVQARIIDIAIKNLWALYKNEIKKGPNAGGREDKGNMRLRLSMFADVHWWDKVRKIFTDLNKYIQRSFVRPTVTPLPKPGTAPRVEAPNPGDYALNEKTGKLERVYSTDQMVIIESIRKYALKVLLVSKNVQTNISSVESIMPLYTASINALIREEAKIAADWASTFKAIKINLHFLNKMRNAVENPYDDVIVERLKKEKTYAEGVVKNTPDRIKPNMNIYGTKLSEYNGNDNDYGFRKRLSAVREENSPPGNLRAEGNDVYELRKEIFRIYGEGYSQYQLKLAADEMAERKRQKEEVENEMHAGKPREKFPFSTLQPSDVMKEGRASLADYLAKGNYVDPAHIVFSTRVSAPDFRNFDPDLDADSDIYRAREAIWKLWSNAFRAQLVKFNALVADMKKAQTAKKQDIPSEYAGVPITARKFRDYDIKLDNNSNFYLIKKRTWTIYHTYQVAYENDIVIGAFGKLYDKTVDFVDGFISSIEQITKDPKSMGVLGSSGSPIMADFQEMINDVEEFNNTFTTAPWSKSFIISKNMLSMNSDNDYANRLKSLAGNVATISRDLNIIVETMKSETDALQVLLRSIDKVDPNKRNPFLDYYSDLEFPKNNATTAIAAYINDYLETTKQPEYDAYGISYILGQIQ